MGEQVKGKRYSIRKVYFYFVLLISFSLIVFFSYIWINKQKDFLDYQVHAFKERLLQKENNLVKREVESTLYDIKNKSLMSKKMLKHTLEKRVDVIYEAIQTFIASYEKIMPEDELKEIIKNMLRNIRFNNDEYFFIATMDGLEVLYPLDPSLEGKSVINLQDVKGNFVVKEEIALLKKQGAGFVTHYWRKNKNSNKEYPKISYIKKLKYFNWYIGTGAYIDDFEKELKESILHQLSYRRFGESGYVYINSYEGESLITNGKVLTGKEQEEALKDPRRTEIIGQQVRIIKQHKSGYLDYHWNKIGESNLVKKTAFVKGFEHWEWIIGAGYYHDEINDVIKNAKEKFDSNFYLEIVLFAFFLLLILIFIIVFVFIINRFIINEFNLFIRAFKNSVVHNELIEDKDIRFKELVFLAESINDIIVDKKELETEIFNKRRIESLGVLAGGIAHDFNNLLTAILANINIAKEFKDLDEVKAILIEAERAASRAKGLTHQLLTFSKGGEPILKTLDLRTFIKETAEFFLTGTNVAIDCSINQDLWSIVGDKGQISQVIENIVINAKQAMNRSGKIFLELENEYVQEEGRKERFVKIQIRDTGDGILPENINKIFDPYFTTKKSGNGLGLASVYSIVKKHHGVIDVYSRYKEGTTFTILLPAVDSIEASTKKRKKEFKAEGKRLLIMDDEEMILNISKRIFSHVGFEVHTSKNGEEMLEKYRESLELQEPYAFVIMDLTIHNGMGGEEAIEELLKVDPDASAIVSSGYSNSPIMANFKDYGFRGCLVKPYKLNDIKSLLADLSKE